jgi:uncharacterized membrane protein
MSQGQMSEQKSEDNAKPTRLRDCLPYLPLLFFILWESGFLHSQLHLITPLYLANLISGLSLLLYFSQERFQKARALGAVLFFIPFLVRDPAPYIFLVLAATASFFRNEQLLKTIFILSPLALQEGLGLGFDLRWMLLFTLLFALVASRHSLLSSREREEKIPRLLIFLSFLILLTSLSPWDPMAKEKNGWIAYDGYHHRLDSPFFENDTLTNSVLRYLQSIGYEARILDEPLTPQILKGYSILILETPEKNLSCQEEKAVLEFVNGGGGLFVLGDHTNLQDCYLNLNPILNSVGLHLNFDYSMLWEPHFPSLAGIDSAEETAGATLSINSSDAMVFYRLKYTTWADQGNWSSEGFMGDILPEKDEQFGVLPICAAVNYGRGRAVAIANSDCLSGPNLLYNYRFVDRIFGYLNYENSFLRSTWFRVLLLLAILCGVWRMRLRALEPWCYSLSLFFIVLIVQSALPAGLNPSETIALDLGHANIEGYGPPHQYRNVFFAIFAQHYGFNPVLTSPIPADLEGYRAYVSMGPTRPFSPQEVEALKSYVQKGGTLLVFDGYHSETPEDTSTAASNSLLEPFGLRLGSSLLGEMTYFNQTAWGFPLAYMVNPVIQVRPADHPLMNGTGLLTLYSAVEVAGGVPLAYYGQAPVMAIKEFGLGRVIVVGDHTVFRNFVSYEPVFSYPDPGWKRFTENLLQSMGGRARDGL